MKKRQSSLKARLSQTLFSGLKKFKDDTTGSILVYASLAMIPVVGFAGMAIDTARGYMLRSHLSESIDAATLAAGKSLTALDIETDVNRYFTLNFGANYMNARVDGPHVNYIEDTNEIRVSATATIDTTFMKLMGRDTLDVSAKTKIQRNVRGMELVLVMDNTGSMRDSGKMTAMKNAAQELIDILYGSRETVDNFWVGLVPYVASVNIGNHYTNWLQGYTPSSYNPTTWKGCVEARTAPYDQNDAPPNVQRFRPYFYPSASDNNWPSVRPENHWQNDGRGPNLGCGPAITPLTAEKSIVSEAIDEMLPWHRGGTLTNIGLVWGWRVLSPRWRGWWNGVDSELPMDYETPLMDKVVIVLTDGVNQFHNFNGNSPQGSDYTAYRRRNQGVLGVTSDAAVTAEVNTRMSTVCSAMKQEGILIYTITFQLNNATTQNLFRNCATSPGHYYNSPTNAELATVFRRIGNELSNLRITE